MKKKYTYDQKSYISSAILAALVMAPYAAAVPVNILFEDTFERATDNDVGNSWVTVREEQANYIRVKDGKLRLRGKNEPELYQKISTVGFDTITIDFKWTQAAGEGQDALNLFWIDDVTDQKLWTTEDVDPVWTMKLSNYDSDPVTVSVKIEAGGELANAAFGFNVNVNKDDEQAFITQVTVMGNKAIATVPDTSSTSLLLGTGLLGLAAVRRRSVNQQKK
jgi:hypothetical protein|tara:strand:+ start:265 stop:927 length:663 start_codon:yes stop_codon:yes gene_type:complete